MSNRGATALSYKVADMPVEIAPGPVVTDKDWLP
jgi:hypothetical protein